MSKALFGNYTQPMYEADDGANLGGGEPSGDPTPEAVAFDPNNISPEVQKYVDQQRTQASKSAAANARKKLMQDESFREQIQQEIEAAQNLTVEEKIQQREAEIQKKVDELSVRENSLTTTKSLLEHGITGEDADALAQILTTADSEVSVNNVETFTRLFDEAVKASTEKMKQELLQNGHTVTTNGGKGTPSYQDRYNSAKEAGNFSEQIRVKTEAAENGVFLT